MLKTLKDYAKLKQNNEELNEWPRVRSRPLDLEQFRKFRLPGEYLSLIKDYEIEKICSSTLSMLPNIYSDVFAFLEGENGSDPDPNDFPYCVIANFESGNILLRMDRHFHNDCTVFSEDIVLQSIKKISPSSENFWCSALEIEFGRRVRGFDQWSQFVDYLDLRNHSEEMILELRRVFEFFPG